LCQFFQLPAGERNSPHIVRNVPRKICEFWLSVFIAQRFTDFFEPGPNPIPYTGVIDEWFVG
jgi:hypothetical protein